ncbi:MAG: oxidoreductase, 2OG-Fe(II) oxygenase [Cytophagia bacterium]|nr:MAG: oxidoreductase, 2OG-Fe(II) oxygenase [Cytophagia bacterium]TAH28047.1 MAG: oxidoreductase, 2OG-Fe(II) oxygenase [Cytophagales bacterium]
MNKVELNNDILLIMDFWTKERCEEYIKFSEEKGYANAKINTGMGQRVVKSVRNNKRVMYKDQNLADDVWNDLKNFITDDYGIFKPLGLNELFRFYRYKPKEEFKKHRDESYIRNENEMSFYTFMIYLNNDFKGGETTFNNNKITPITGMALVFLHSLEHSGNPVIEGTKYVLRTDIMYQRTNQP